MAVEWDMNPDDIQSKIMEAITSAGEEIGITGVGAIQNLTPVKTGTLKRSITFKKVVSGTKVTVRFGTSIVYSAKVEFENKSYLREGMRRQANTFAKIVKNYIKERVGNK